MRSILGTVLPVMVILSAVSAHDMGLLAAETDADGWQFVEIEGSVLSWMENEESYSFRLDAPATGWLAVGFGGGPAMKDASLIIGYADDEGSHYRDDHGTSPISHSPDMDRDGTDDIIEADVIDSDGSSSFTFTIPKEPADELDPVLSPGITIRVLVAWGTSDGFSGMHSEAHSAEIEL